MFQDPLSRNQKLDIRLQVPHAKEQSDSVHCSLFSKLTFMYSEVGSKKLTAK